MITRTSVIACLMFCGLVRPLPGRTTPSQKSRRIVKSIDFEPVKK